MAPQSSQKTGLNLEDFRRLGVRPHEYRLTVIRRAAIRSARTLAEQQLTAPTMQTGVQLSRVATSTYRLLDPRKRSETSHRAYVGRILPQALSWAGQTNFHNELSDFGSTAGEIGKLPFERSSFSDAELIEMLDLDSPPRSKHLSKQNWTSSLSDADLLQTTSLTRRVTRWNARSRFPWLALAAAGLVFGATLSFAAHRWLGDEPAYVSLSGDETTAGSNGSRPTSNHNQVQRLSAVTTDQQVAPTADAAPARRRLVPEEMRELLAIADASIIPAPNDRTHSDSDHERIGALPRSQDQVDALGNVSPEGVEVALSNHEAIDPGAPSRHASADASSSTTASQSSDADSSPASLASGLAPTLPGLVPTLPDPFGPDVDLDLEQKSAQQVASAPTAMRPETTAQDSLAQDSLGQDSVAQDSLERDTRDQDAPAAAVATAESWQGVLTEDFAGPRLAGTRRVSIPGEASQRTARRELIELMPQLDIQVEADNARSRIKDLELIERQYKTGTPEHWVVRTWIAETAWLFETAASVEERLSSLVAIYDVSSEQLLAETFVAASAHASLPKTRDHLMAQGLRLADQLLMASDPAACKQVVEALLPFLSKSPGEDSHLRQYLNDFSHAASLMTRQAEVVKRARAPSGQPPAADRKVLGQHYCLLLRRWDEGLEWLSDCYDRRIASIAREELQLGDNPTTDELKEVGEQWLAVAARSDGREADSMRLHAIDLLRKAQPKAEALMKLEIDRMMDDAIFHVPPHLLPLPDATLGLMRGSRLRRDAPAASGVPFF